jgi:glutamyl-tRNA synthetase
VSQFRDDGYLPEALINYLALIGWSPGTEDEIFSMDDLIRVWKIEQVQSAGGKWDKDRLDYFNGVWIRKLSVDELVRRLEPFVPAEWDREVLRKIAPHIQERMKTLKDAQDQIRFLFTDDIGYDRSTLIPKKSNPMTTTEALARARAVLSPLDPFIATVIEPPLVSLAAELNWSKKDLAGTIRMAITGRQVGPPLYQSLEVLGKEKSLRRIEAAQDMLAGVRA